MPPEELNRDKPKVSVYAILLILAFVFTATSIGFVWHELYHDYNWNKEEGMGEGDGGDGDEFIDESGDGDEFIDESGGGEGGAEPEPEPDAAN